MLWDQKVKKAQAWRKKYEDLVAIIDMQDGVAGNVEEQIMEMKRRADMLDGVQGNFKQQKAQWEIRMRNAQSWKKKYEDLVVLIDMQDGVEGNVEDQLREMKRRADMLDGVRGNFKEQ